MSFINNLFSLDGKVALVIGGSGVLGGKMGESLALAGAKTAVFYSANKDGAEATVAEITKKGGISASFHADARDAASLKHAITQVKQTWGRIDILVNAPGVNSAAPVLLEPALLYQLWERRSPIDAAACPPGLGE